MHSGSKESYTALFLAVSTTLKGALTRLKELGAIKTEGASIVLDLRAGSLRLRQCGPFKLRRADTLL
jgi:hypothetical protein